MPAALDRHVKSAQAALGDVSKRSERERKKPVSAGSTIPADRARGLEALWRRRNYDVNRLLVRSGVSRELLASPNSRLTQAQFSSFFRSASIIRRDESWGLCPQRIPLGTFAMICRSAVAQRTIGQALTVGLANFRVVAPSFAGRLQIHSRSCARVVLRDAIEESDARRQFHATFMFFLYTFMCWIADGRIPLQAVHFVSASTGAGQELAKVYRAPVVYGSERTEMIFDARWLRLANVQDLQSVNEFLRKSPGNLAVAFHDKADVAERVRRYLRKNISRPNSLDDAAALLRMSVATLRRRLSNEGMSFQKLKDDVRRDMAIHLLVESDVRLEELASRVGFLEVSAFHRAFRRWTGSAPSDYRNRGIA